MVTKSIEKDTELDDSLALSLLRAHVTVALRSFSIDRVRELDHVFESKTGFKKT